MARRNTKIFQLSKLSYILSLTTAESLGKSAEQYFLRPLQIFQFERCVLSRIFKSRQCIYEWSVFTAFETFDVTFDLGEEYKLNYFMNQGVMVNKCSRPKPNILFFYSFEPDKRWNLTTEMVFSKLGMISTQTILNPHISAKKFYTKRKKLFLLQLFRKKWKTVWFHGNKNFEMYLVPCPLSKVHHSLVHKVLVFTT